MSRIFSVHPKYIKEVKLAWRRKTDERKQNLAEELGQSLPAVGFFLKGKPVSESNFSAICQILGLNWRKIAGVDVQESQISSLPPQVNSGGAIALTNSADDFGDVNEALNALIDTLCEMLRRLTRKAAALVNADRASIFLLDRPRKSLAAIIAEDGGGGNLVIEIPLDRGIAGLAATSSSIINIPFDVYNDPRSIEAKNTDRKTAYRTYTILAVPLLNEQKDLVAVVQVINKLKPNQNPEDDLEEDLSRRIDTKGFTHKDETLLSQFAPSILRTLERCQLCYQLAQNLREDKAIVRGGVVLPKTQLIAELKQKQQYLRRSLERI